MTEEEEDILEGKSTMEDTDDERSGLLSRSINGECTIVQTTHNDPETADRYHLVYGMFFLLGISTLLPYNMFITAHKYFEYKVRDTGEKKSVENYITIASLVPNVIFMLLNTFIIKAISVRCRLILSLIVMIVMFFVILALVKVNTDPWEMIFLAVTLTILVIFSAFGAVLQGGVFGLCGMFPHEYTQAVMSGMGIGGTFSAVANIISLLFAHGDILDSALWYFVSAILVMLTTLVCYCFLNTNAFANYSQRQFDETLEKAKMLKSQVNGHVTNRMTFIQPRNVTISVIKQIWDLAFSVFYIFLVTLACFPGINSKIVSTNHNKNLWTGTYFTPVTCFLLFNLGDWAGRVVAGWIPLPPDKLLIVPIASVLRSCFIPLFLMCNTEPHQGILPFVFDNDAWPIVFMVIFAVSNGYLGTISMMYGPKRVSAEHCELAGMLMSFFLTLGLAVGAMFSYLLVYLL